MGPVDIGVAVWEKDPRLLLPNRVSMKVFYGYLKSKTALFMSGLENCVKSAKRALEESRTNLIKMIQKPIECNHAAGKETSFTVKQ